MLTDDELREAWDDGYSEEEIAETYGVPVEEVRHRRRKVLRLRRRPDKWVPSPEEIESGTNRIRAGWSDTIRESRRVGDRPGWVIPIVPAPEEDGVNPQE